MHRALIALLLFATVAQAAPPNIGPELGAASRFGQTERPDLLEAALANGIRSLRDEIYWERVEQGPGVFRFDQPMTAWPGPLGAGGGEASLIVNHRHADYDGGTTPFSAGAMRAQAGFAAAALAEFPALEAVEIGNEVNSPNFLEGPVRDAGLEARAGYHVSQLAAVREAVAGTGARVLGGGVHSIPLGYLAHVVAAGGAELMDSLALHPYDTPPESFPAQIAELRRMPAFADMPVEVTEFGLTDAAAAPGYLMRYYCAMALSGVSHAVWYPLADRGDGLAPLLTAEGEITPVGRTFKLLQRELQGRPARDASPDPFTRACIFGDQHLLIWGAARSLDLAQGLVAFGPDGLPRLAGPLALSEEVPLLIRSTRAPISVEMLGLGPQSVLADSFLQFGYPKGRKLRSPGDGFERFGKRDGTIHPLVTKPGQERDGVPWVPYRAAEYDGGLRLLPDMLLPAGDAAMPFEMVHAYVAHEPMPVLLEVSLSPSARSSDGVGLAIALDGVVLLEEVVTAPQAITLGPLELARGARLEIAVGPEEIADGDDSRYRFRVLHRRD